MPVVAISVTRLCNMSLARLGANRLNSFEDDKSVEAIQCRTHYAQTRDALLRSNWWAFAMDRSELSADTEDPDFQWNNQFVLPSDFLRAKGLFDATSSYQIEGERLLTNDGSVNLVYVKVISDPTKFDPLFVEILILQLAIKLVMPLTKDKVLRSELGKELVDVMSRGRTVNFAETNTTNRADRNLWVESRRGGHRIDSQLGSGG